MIFCVKTAVTLQYLRMFAPNRTINPFVFYGSWLIMTACAVFYILTTLLTVFVCTPREKIWNKLYPGGHCMNYRAIIVSTSFFNIVSDVFILLLPVRTVWKLQIPTKKKIAISLLFGTGLTWVASSRFKVAKPVVQFTDSISNAQGMHRVCNACILYDAYHKSRQWSRRYIRLHAQCPLVVHRVHSWAHHRLYTKHPKAVPSQRQQNTSYVFGIGKEFLVFKEIESKVRPQHPINWHPADCIFCWGAALEIGSLDPWQRFIFAYLGKRLYTSISALKRDILNSTEKHTAAL
jgi:hypothetical protein